VYLVIVVDDRMQHVYSLMLLISTSVLYLVIVACSLAL
jgi:hypothetical protein